MASVSASGASMGKAGRAGLTFALLLADFGLCSQHGLAARGKLELVQRSGVTKVGRRVRRVRRVRRA